MKRDPSNYDLNMPHPAKALTTPVTSLAVLAFCQHSKLVRSRFHQLEAGKWGGGEDGRKEGEGGREELTWSGLACTRPKEGGVSRGCVRSGSQLMPYRFSAFWLRSSVVSVLISLISDTLPIWGLHIKRIFGPGS